MIPGLLIKDQIKKISTFIYLLVLLFVLFIVFQLLFNWEGISIIVNVYLYVFSFYLIFNFSLIEIEPLKRVYRDKYGKYGDFVLFSVTRILPFAVIYLITVLFTLINYYNSGFWPWRPFLNLLDGRFSNIVFYSLILLVILKLKREPRVAIPLFLFLAVIYFSLYKLVYTFSPMGMAISLLKYFQISVGFFFLLFEFTSDKKKIFKGIALSFLLSAGVYVFLVSTYNIIFKFSRFASYSHIKTSSILLKMGYSYPLNDMQNAIIRKNDPYLFIRMIEFFEYYKKDLQLNDRQWEDLILKGDFVTTDKISEFIKDRDINLSCKRLTSAARSMSYKYGKYLVDTRNYIAYCSTQYSANRDCFNNSFKLNNRYYKIWLIKVLGKSKDPAAIPFLVDKITGFDNDIARESFNALSEITGIKKIDGRAINDLEIVEMFRDYYRFKKVNR